MVGWIVGTYRAHLRGSVAKIGAVLLTCQAVVFSGRAEHKISADFRRQDASGSGDSERSMASGAASVSAGWTTPRADFFGPK